MSAVVKLHDEKSEGLSRSMILEMVQKASGNKLTIAQCAHTWDRTILPYGQKLGLLTGYVKPQSGTSKRTAAGAPELQKRYYDAVTDSINEVRQVAKKVLKDDVLVEKMMPVLIFNLDEEALLAMGKNYAVAGSQDRRKHENQINSSRFFFLQLPTKRIFFFIKNKCTLWVNALCLTAISPFDALLTETELLLFAVGMRLANQAPRSLCRLAKCATQIILTHSLSSMVLRNFPQLL